MYNKSKFLRPPLKRLYFFPLLSKSDQVLLKAIGVRQHLVRRKLMLKSMDAILFGPPIYDNTLKGE